MVSTRRRGTATAAPEEQAAQDPLQDELQTAADAAEPVADLVTDVDNQVCGITLAWASLAVYGVACVPIHLPSCYKGASVYTQTGSGDARRGAAR